MSDNSLKVSVQDVFEHHELLVNLFANMFYDDIKSFCLTNRKFTNIWRDGKFWKMMIYSVFNGRCLLSKPSNYSWRRYYFGLEHSFGLNFVVQKFRYQTYDNELELKIYCDTIKSWTYKGQKHRLLDLPARIGLYDSQIVLEMWYVDGKIHRENDKPAAIVYSPNGNVLCEYWYVNGLRHRENEKPAIIEYYDDGIVKGECWYVNGLLHRVNDKPAMIYYNSNGEKVTQKWWLNGNLHRDNDLPAEIIMNGKFTGWYTHGVVYRRF